MHYFEPIDQTVITEIWKAHGKSVDSAKEDVEALKNWLNAQPHLPHTLTNVQLEAFLGLNRGSIEKAKSKIDMYYTMRTIYPNVFQNPFSERILHARKFLYCLPLPKLCADLSRILFIKMKDVDKEDLDAYACVANFFNIVELRIFEDKCLSHTAIIDLENYKISYLMHLTPSLFKCLYTIGSKALTTRANAIHLINAPSFIDQTLMVVKSIITPKLGNKIVVHKDATSLLEAIDKNVLPKEYGGNEKSLDELEELLYKKMEEYREFFDQRDQMKVNEELRPEKSRNDEFLGYYGNFKQLEVD